jgi:hypothetical protein
MKLRYIVLLLAILGITAFLLPSCGGGGNDNDNDGNPLTPYPIPDDGKIPDNPRYLSAIAGSTTVTLTWEPVFSAVGYRVYKSEDGVTFIRLTASVSFTENTAIITNLINDKPYYFGVAAVDERGNESGIAYLGGSPTAKAVIPTGPVPPPLPFVPEVPNDFSWVPGDRMIMVTWNYPNENPAKYLLEREMQISPYASLPGQTSEAKSILRHALEAAMKATFILPTTFDKYSPGDFINTFTIPATPYYVDTGIVPVGIPPNFIPTGLVDGDITYSYKLGAVSGPYTTYAPVLYEVVPDDDPPHPPVMVGAIIISNTAGDGLAVFIQWIQPTAPEGSDIKGYVLQRIDPDLTVNFIINSPFDKMDYSVTYTDQIVTRGTTYTYTVTAQDYSAQLSTPSNTITITVPAIPVEEPPV